MFSYIQCQTYCGHASALNNELQNLENMFEHNETGQNLESIRHPHHGHIKIEFGLLRLQFQVHIIWCSLSHKLLLREYDNNVLLRLTLLLKSFLQMHERKKN